MTMKNSLISSILLLLAYSGFAQASAYDVFGTQTNPRSGSYALITLDTLEGATTLSDIYARYRSSWVAEYIAVEVAAGCRGEIHKGVSKDDRLTDEQLRILQTADPNCPIEVAVDYIPKNNLTYNPPRKMSFSLRMVPIFEAKYPGGLAQLKRYFKEQIMDQIPATVFGQIERSIVQFQVTGEGQVADVQVLRTSGDREIDQLMLEAICNMPQWRPAKNAEGRTISQTFQFDMGTMLLRCDFEY